MLMQKQLDDRNLELSKMSMGVMTTNNSIPQSVASSRPTNEPIIHSLKEADLFSRANSSRNCSKSPVKTTPFADGADRLVKFPSAKVKFTIYKL